MIDSIVSSILTGRSMLKQVKIVKLDIRLRRIHSYDYTEFINQTKIYIRLS